MKDNATPTITTGNMPAATKVFIPGQTYDIRVPLRHIQVGGGEPPVFLHI